MDEATAEPLLAVEGLTVGFGPRGRETPVVRDVSFGLARGETLAIVGESGSGKSVTALGLLGLLPTRGARVMAGTARFEGADLLALSPEARRRVRGARIGMIFQEPMTSLNPVVTIGVQMCEALKVHHRLGRAASRARAVEMLDLVGIQRPDERLGQYPHEFSGGMRQRVMIAMMMALKPALLIADEPTTALDVTIQAQILRLMAEVKDRFDTGLLLITHDMGVVAQTADRVLVLRRGRVVEEGGVEALFAAPRADYTKALLAAVPRLDRPSERDADAEAPAARPVVEVEGLHKSFGGGGLFARLTGPTATRALDGVDLTLGAAETLALVGESGSGKSTLGRAIARLVDVDAGTVRLDGADLTRARGRALKRLRRSVQMIFQDPYASLNPRITIGAAIAEPLLIHGLANRGEARDRVAALLERVELDADMMGRYPHEFSGGQRQRIAIARAIAIDPAVVIADEPTSALDVSVQARILALLDGLKRERAFACLFISHDLAVVRQVSRRVAVMRSGRIVELGPTEAVLGTPRHPYTRALIAAAPVPDPARRSGFRSPPAEAPYPSGPLTAVAPGHWVAA